MNTAIVGVISTFGGMILKAIIDLCSERYKKAREIKEAQYNLETHLRSQVLVWREHAYAVRVAAVKNGVRVEDLPSVPKED